MNVINNPQVQEEIPLTVNIIKSSVYFENLKFSSSLITLQLQMRVLDIHLALLNIDEISD